MMSKRTKQVLEYLQAIGSASARQAQADLGINGGSWSKRLSELIALGFPITSDWHRHPVTKDRYKKHHYDLSAGVKATVQGRLI